MEKEIDCHIFYLKKFGKGMMIWIRVIILFIRQTGIVFESQVSLTRGDTGTAEGNWDCTWASWDVESPSLLQQTEASLGFALVYKWHLSLISYNAAYHGENSVKAWRISHQKRNKKVKTDCSFIHSYNKCLLVSYYAAGTVLGTRTGLKKKISK